MNVRLDRLWAADRLPPWCRVIYRTDALVEYGAAPTDAVYDGGEWSDVRGLERRAETVTDARRPF